MYVTRPINQHALVYQYPSHPSCSTHCLLKPSHPTSLHAPNSCITNAHQPTNKHTPIKYIINQPTHTTTTTTSPFHCGLLTPDSLAQTELIKRRKYLEKQGSNLSSGPAISILVSVPAPDTLSHFSDCAYLSTTCRGFDAQVGKN